MQKKNRLLSYYEKETNTIITLNNTQPRSTIFKNQFACNNAHLTFHKCMYYFTIFDTFSTLNYTDDINLQH